MNVAVTIEHRFDRTPDGSVWTSAQFPYSFWVRYLEVFDCVHPVARVREVSAVPGDWVRADGLGVSFRPVPYYLGLRQYVATAARVHTAVRRAPAPTDAVILRVGSHLANCLEPALRKSQHPYGVEVVGDPYEVFAPRAIRHPLRPFLRWTFTRQLRRQCANACAAAYVTEHALQRRYPCPRYSVGCSDVQVADDSFVAVRRAVSPTHGGYQLIMVGSLDQLYKAPDILIDAVAKCISDGLDLRLILLGDGRYRSQLEARAANHGLGDRVQFLGQLPAGDSVREQLDQADVFVLPSRTEGLPRAMIEAMARALPCLGSTAGGIPELLAPDDMVPPGDANALAAAIRAVLADPQRMARMSARNLAKAREYHEESLRPRRRAFYQEVRAVIGDWLKMPELKVEADHA